MRDRLQQELLEWDQAVTRFPHDARVFVRRGMARFKLALIAESIADFDRAEQIDPHIKPYLWQRGLSYYYAEQFAAGAAQFEADLTVNQHDVEETIWRYLCLAQLADPAAHRSLLEVKHEPRPILRQVYQLFSGKASVADLLAIGATADPAGQFYSHLYAGLYCEAEGQTDLAQTYMNRAVELFRTQYQSDDYMGYLAIVHQQIRGWTP
jgi:tetratricopeptide (TPR) repeat protein